MDAIAIATQVNTYSISNPFQPPADKGNWSVFLDHGGMFKVMLATSVSRRAALYYVLYSSLFAQYRNNFYAQKIQR